MNFDYVDKAIALAKKGQAGTAFIHDFFVEMMKLKAANETRALHAAARLSGRRRFAVIGLDRVGGALRRQVHELLPALSSGAWEHPEAGSEEESGAFDRHHGGRSRPYRRSPRLCPAEKTCRSGIHVLPRGVPGEAGAEWIQFLSFLWPARPSKCLYGLGPSCRSLSSSHRLRVFGRLSEAFQRISRKRCGLLFGRGHRVGRIRASRMVGRSTPAAPANVLDLPGSELLQAASERPDRYFRSLIMSAGQYRVLRTSSRIGLAFCRWSGHPFDFHASIGGLRRVCCPGHSMPRTKMSISRFCPGCCKATAG